MKLDAVEMPVIIFLVLCAVMTFLGWKWGKNHTLKNNCCYSGCLGGDLCGCHGLEGRITNTGVI